MKKESVENLAVQIATLFGTGFVPGAPGTLGSLFGLMGYVITFLIVGEIGVGALSAGLLFAAIWSSDLAARQLKQKDPLCIVIDEVVGMWITLLGTQSHGPVLLLGFLLFRFFDIVKPFPIKNIEKLPGGFGIVLDDVAAGIYANVSLRLVLRMLGS